MDISSARTFLAILESGNFVSAARRLHVTQSTVSTRIKNLEGVLGKDLFTRNKGGCEPTPAGVQFQRYARAMVRAWEEGRHQVAVPEKFSSTLSVGGQYSLWSRLLLRWLPEFSRRAPDVAIRAAAGMPARLMSELVEGVLDIAVMYSPEHRAGLIVEELAEDHLILVTGGAPNHFEADYVFVDWGEDFRIWHAASHERLHNPGLTLDLGEIGVHYLINERKSGYFPARIAKPYIDAGGLKRLPAPVFSYPVYVVYKADFASAGAMDAALKTLREIGADIAE